MDESDNNLTYVIVDRNSKEKKITDFADSYASEDRVYTSNDFSGEFISSDENSNDNQVLGRYYDKNTTTNYRKQDMKAESKDNFMEDVGDSKDNLNYYVAVSLLSIITYIILAYSSNVSLLELVDLEIPLIIFLSCAMVFLAKNWSRLYTYILFAAAIAVMIMMSFNYSFFLMIVFFSELAVYSLNMILTNKDDYNYMAKID